MMMTLSEPGCYCGVVLSAMIARRLYLMDRPSLTFCNGLLLLYFTIDTVMGALETFFSFQLYKERLIYSDLPLIAHHEHLHHTVLVLLIMKRDT